MRVIWDGLNHLPTIKVDGKVIKNVSSADDVQRVVEYVKARKIVTIRGNVEIGQ